MSRYGSLSVTQWSHSVEKRKDLKGRFKKILKGDGWDKLIPLRLLNITEAFTGCARRSLFHQSGTCYDPLVELRSEATVMTVSGRPASVGIGAAGEDRGGRT